MVESLQNEIWIPVREYEEFYEVSNVGRFKALDRIYFNGRGYVHHEEMLLKLGRDRAGYMLVAFTKNGISTTNRAHRIVAMHFIHNPDGKPEVNHINGIKDDNRIENLEWVSQSENQLHAYKLGLSVPTKGEKHGRSKLMDQDIETIRELYDTGKYTHTEIANQFGIHREYCARIIRRKSWTHI